MYEKLDCWCKTYDKEKSEAVDLAREQINTLQSDIEELTAGKSRLETEIPALKEDIAQNVEALKRAAAIREKEAAEFHEAEKGLLVGIKQITNAITVLSK